MNPREMELIPVGQVTIYKDVAGREILGVSSHALPVIDLVYLDKTDYVVEVEFGGKRGYVRKDFHLSHK